MNNEFWDNAAEKAKAALDLAVKATGDAVTSGRQKIDIAAMENKLKKCYEELGRLYVRSLEDGAEPVESLSAKVAEIRERTEAILRAKEENAAVFGKKLCPACGAAVDKKSVYCEKCGIRFEDAR